jgi:hypothetical protein
LYRELKGRHVGVHILGDAFAPRRMVFATRQAFELARTLLDLDLPRSGPDADLRSNRSVRAS